MAKPKDDDTSLKRLGGGRWQTRDERFTIEPQSGTWVVVDAEQTDDLGLPLVRGPFASLAAAKDAIAVARRVEPGESPLPARAERLRPISAASADRSARRGTPTADGRGTTRRTATPAATTRRPADAPPEREPTAPVLARMTMSLDGFVVDRNGSVERLHADLAALAGTGYMTAMQAETGAVLMGRRTFGMADDPDWYVGNYEFQVPIVVLTHHPPATAPRQDDHLTFTFVDGLASAVRQARLAAGERAVTVVGGIDVIRQLLRAGLVDELAIDIMPVILAGGRRLFGEGELSGLTLTTRSVDRVGDRIVMRFGVERPAD
jgi:dihydrofolate reductase